VKGGWSKLAVSLAAGKHCDKLRAAQAWLVPASAGPKPTGREKGQAYAHWFSTSTRSLVEVGAQIDVGTITDGQGRTESDTTLGGHLLLFTCLS
jgi:hypothetical protein